MEGWLYALMGVAFVAQAVDRGVGWFCQQLATLWTDPSSWPLDPPSTNL